MQSLLKDQDNIDKGYDKKAVEVAQSVLSDNIPLDFIAKHSGLSIEAIEQLQQEN